jgi:hypothetical protein
MQKSLLEMTRQKFAGGLSGLWKGHFNTMTAYGVAGCCPIEDFLGLLK